MSEPLTDTTVRELVELGRASGSPQLVAGGNSAYAVIPSTCKVEDLTRFIVNDNTERPVRKAGTIKVLDGPSFCEYHTLFADGDSRVFADETTGRFLAILDYHQTTEGPSNTARWCKHRLDLTLRASAEWTAWKAKDGKQLSQTDFAEFIEDNAPDIVTPDAATMREVAMDLSAKSDVDFGSAIRLQNGQVQFKYSEKIVGTFGNGQIEIPERFVISIPVHIGTERIEVTARLRYRINSGKLTFSYHLLRPDAIEREAFAATRSAISTALGIRIINGTPA